MKHLGAMSSSIKTTHFPYLWKHIGYLLMGLLLAILTLFPLFIMILASFKPAGFNPLGMDSLTLSNYIEVFGDPATYRLLLNTFLYALGSLCVGMSLAMIMAWLVERTDLPLKQYVYVAMFVPMAVPGAITAFGYTFLLNPSNGLLNTFIRNLFGLEITAGPLNIYTLGGMIFVTGLAFTPTMFLMLSSIIKNLDPTLEESGLASGASRLKVMNHIVFPMLRPGILSAFVFFVIILIETMEIPLILGYNARFNVLSMEVFNRSGGADSQFPEYGIASTYGMIGLVIGLVLLLVYYMFTKNSKKYAVITGKGYRARMLKLGKWKFAAILFFILFFTFELILPIAVLFWFSLLPFLQPPSLEMLDMLSFKNYAKVFDSSRFLMALKNTAIMTVICSLGCMILSAFVSWLVVRGKGRFAKILDLIAFVPHLIPTIVLALALLLATVGTPLYGTIWVLVLGYIIRYLPFGVRTMSSVLMQISGELEEAAYASGGSKFATFRKVTIPIILPAFINGIVWVASHAMRDLTLPLLLISTTNLVVGSYIYETWSNGNETTTAVIAVLLVSVLILVVTPIQIYLQKRMEKIHNI